MTMDIEEAQDKIAIFRRYHVLMFIYISIVVGFTTCWQEFSIVYIGYQPEHYCSVADNSSLPPDHKGRAGLFDRCNVYVDIGSGSNETRECTEGWVYMDADGDQVVPYQGSTIVTQWSLVCNDEYLKDFSQTIYAFGIMIGAMIFSIISDYVGRKPVFLVCIWAQEAVGIASAYVTNYRVFLSLRFFLGALQQGIMLPGFILSCELFAARYRTFSGMITQNTWGIAAGVLPLFAYLITDWRYFQTFISLIGLISIPMVCVMPESVLWLTANDMNDEAEKILQKAAKINKIEMPARILDRSATEDGTSNGLLGRLKRLDPRKKNKNKKEEIENEFKYTVFDLITNRILLLHVIIVTILLIVNSLVYYGLSLSTATLAGDRFVNASISAFIEIPAYTSAFLALKKWGRRYPLITYHIIAGAGLIISQLIPEQTGNGTSLAWLIITFNMIGKFGITASFGVAYLYAPELFPTTIRNQALGLGSLFGRLGTVMASYTPYVIARVPWLAGPLFGGLAIFAGLLVILLPETHNRPLPQTIEDIENWSKKPHLRHSIRRHSEKQIHEEAL